MAATRGYSMFAARLHTYAEYSWDSGSPPSLPWRCAGWRQRLGMGNDSGSGRRRKHRSWGAVEQLPSGRFRARVMTPEGRYVWVPMTFALRTDAGVWLGLQHADMVRGGLECPPRVHDLSRARWGSR